MIHLFQNDKNQWLMLEECELPATTKLTLSESDQISATPVATPTPSPKRKKKELFPEEVFLNEASGFLKNAKMHASSSDTNEVEGFR